jgi:hypothetical protein
MTNQTLSKIEFDENGQNTTHGIVLKKSTGAAIRIMSQDFDDHEDYTSPKQQLWIEAQEQAKQDRKADLVRRAEDGKIRKRSAAKKQYVKGTKSFIRNGLKFPKPVWSTIQEVFAEYYRYFDESEELAPELAKVLRSDLQVFCHILTCQLETGENVPLPWETVYKAYGCTDSHILNRLVDGGVLEVIEFEYGQYMWGGEDGGRCREFSVKPSILERIRAKYTEANFQGLTERVDLNGKLSKYRKSTRTNRDGNLHPDGVQRAIDAITKPYFNRQACDLYFAVLGILNPPEGTELYQQWVCAQYCYSAVLAANARQVSGSIWTYQPSFTMQNCGRISELGGGLQGSPRDFKAIAMMGVPNARNYDLKNAHAYIWLEDTKQINAQSGSQLLDTQPLDSYLNLCGTDKEVYARSLGMSEDCMKDCFYSLMNGAPLPVGDQKNLPEKKLDGGRTLIPNAISYRIWQEFKKPDHGYQMFSLYLQAVDNFVAAFKPLEAELCKWHEVNFQRFVKAAYTGKNGQLYVKNANNAVFNLSEFISPNAKSDELNWKNLPTLKRQLAAHHLQGKESKFIHTLSALLAERGISVRTNEHDGLSVIGEFSDELMDEIVKEAKGLSGVHCVGLVEKPLSKSKFVQAFTKFMEQVSTAGSPGRVFSDFAVFSPFFSSGSLVFHSVLSGWSLFWPLVPPSTISAPLFSLPGAPLDLVLSNNITSYDQKIDTARVRGVSQNSKAQLMGTELSADGLTKGEVEKFISGMEYTTISQVLAEFKTQLDPQARASQMKVATILESLGCIHKRKRISGKQTWVYVVPQHLQALTPVKAPSTPNQLEQTEMPTQQPEPAPVAAEPPVEVAPVEAQPEPETPTEFKVGTEVLWQGTHLIINGFRGERAILEGPGMQIPALLSELEVQPQSDRPFFTLSRHRLGIEVLEQCEVYRLHREMDEAARQRNPGAFLRAS